MAGGSSRDFFVLNWESQVRRLRLEAGAALSSYGLEGAPFRLLKYLDNAVFKVRGLNEQLFVLRVSRQDTRAQVKSEMLWLEALRRDTRLRLPEPIRTKEASLVVGSGQSICCLLSWVPGIVLRNRLTEKNVRAAGEMTATLHRHSQSWSRPPGFERPLWDLDWLLGPDSILCRSESTEFLDGRDQEVVARAAEQVARLVGPLGDGPEVIGLVHADVHHGNFVLHKGGLGLIDFDDCCFGYYLHDLATMINPLGRVSDGTLLARAYLQGYEQGQGRSIGFPELLPTFLAFRELVDMKFILDSKNPRVHERRVAWAERAVGRLEDYLAGKLGSELTE